MKIGDTVRLKSGGAKMIIEGFGGNTFPICLCNTESRGLQATNINPNCLEVVDLKTEEESEFTEVERVAIGIDMRHILKTCTLSEGDKRVRESVLQKTSH